MIRCIPVPVHPPPRENDPSIVPAGTPLPAEVDDPDPLPAVFPVREPDTDSPRQLL